MADFVPAMRIVFGVEGGLADTKGDKGGITNYGISLAFLKQCGIDKDDLDNDGIKYELVGDLNNDGVVDRKDIIQLTPDYANKLYFKYFWCTVNAGMIEDQRLATILFDMSVNSGPETAARKLQGTLRQLGSYVDADGNIGPLSLKAINTYKDATQLCYAFISNRKTYYYQIADSDPTQTKFLRSWMNRLLELKKKVGL